MGETTSNAMFIWKVFVFYTVWTLFLQIFAFVKGAPSFFSSAPLTAKFASLFGLGVYTGAPLFLIFIINVAFSTVIGYFVLAAFADFIGKFIP